MCCTITLMIPKKTSFLWEQFWDFLCCCPFWNRFGWRPPATEKLQKSIDAFCKIIQAEDRLLILLSRRWIPVLCAFAGSSMWEPLEGYVSEPQLFVIFRLFPLRLENQRLLFISYLKRLTDQTCSVTCQMPQQSFEKQFLAYNPTLLYQTAGLPKWHYALRESSTAQDETCAEK